MNTTKTLIQIGINNFCEFIYVAWTEWAETYFQPDIGYPPLPEELYDRCLWRYVGVDIRDYKLDEYRVFYQDSPNIEFVHALIFDKDGEVQIHDTYRVAPYVEAGHLEKEMQSTSLATLFEQVGIPEILVMDIEGSELQALTAYDFHHKPELIIVEIHSFDACQAILKKLLNVGYALYDFADDRIFSEKNKIGTFAFIREDKVSERIKNMWCYRA